MKFVPRKEGELLLHQFDFRGSISPTGFRSHFVLGVESESGWATPADYALNFAESLVTQLEEEQQKVNRKRSRSSEKAIAAPEPATDKDNSSSSTASSCSTQSETTDGYLALSLICTDGGTQSRAGLNDETIEEYAEAMDLGATFPPVLVFYDGFDYWLTDGFHRVAAESRLEWTDIAVEVCQGTQRDAILYSVRANATHGLRRTNADKRRAVETLLRDEEWSQWSDREIARRCCVDKTTVSNLRKSIWRNSPDTKLNTERKVQREGKTYTVNTANIGKAALTTEELQLLGNGVTVTSDNPLNPRQSGTIPDLPEPDSLPLELDTGERELIELKHLKPAIAHHLKLSEGGLVEVSAPGNSKIDGRWGRIASVCERTVEVWLRDVDTMTLQKHTFKHQQVTPLPLEQEPQLKQLCDRLNKLRECGLDPFEVEIVNLLERTVVLTPTELEYLAHIEQRHGDRSG